MPVLTVITLLSLGYYIYFKFKAFRANHGDEKQLYSAKAFIALGVFVGVFGLNRLFISQSATVVVICSIFLLSGCAAVWTGWKTYKFYLLNVREEKTEN